MRNFFVLIFLVGILLTSCSDNNKNIETNSSNYITSSKFNAWLDSVFEVDVMKSPMFLTRLGRPERKGELDNISDEFIIENLKEKEERLAFLKKIKTDSLDSQTLLSYQLYVDALQFELDNQQFMYHDYPVNQMHGAQSELPSFMINMHSIKSLEDAQAYISRINAFDIYIDQLIQKLKTRAEKGIIVPQFVFQHLYNDCNNIINTNSVDNNILYKDFLSKVSELNLESGKVEELSQKIGTAVHDHLIPSYQRLLNYFKELEKLATTDDGVWKLPQGTDFYSYRLKYITTTDWSADKIHETGLAEVARIHDEMKAIMKSVGFEGSLQDFFKFMKTDDQFYYEDGPEGKRKMEEGYAAIIDSMKLQLDDLFYTKPKADIIVKAVEEYREKSAGKAFYEDPAIDGSRPGIFYANLYRMRDMPTYEMEALAYHEGIPGHHMQISIAQEMENVPMFRKFGNYTAYIEGWGLYCEKLPKEIGFYKDPYSDFGRLAMELWRACRLVVDVGIHHKKWTREQAIQYLLENTPNSENSCTKAIERYIVMPAQATAYKVGMIKILEIREKAKQALGDQFDIKKFHDIFLLSGPVPLHVFEKSIDDWIASIK